MTHKKRKKLGNLRKLSKCDNHAYKQAILVQRFAAIVLWTFCYSSRIRQYVRCWFLLGSDFFIFKRIYLLLTNSYRFSFPFFSTAGPRWRGAGFGSSLSCRANRHWQALSVPAHRGTVPYIPVFRSRGILVRIQMRIRILGSVLLTFRIQESMFFHIFWCFNKWNLKASKFKNMFDDYKIQFITRKFLK